MTIKPRILIVEDSKELVELLFRRFETDYALSYAITGEDGLALARSAKPDIMLLDITLPKMSGFDVLRELQLSETTSDIPVLILTALSDTDNVVKGFHMGAADYVVKPFNFVELSARIKAHLTIKELQKRVIDMERLSILREVAVSFNHEVNNPLTAISVFAHFLKDKVGKDSVELSNSVEGIINEVTRISGIVSKLSAATRAASVDYQPGIKMIDFGHLTKDE